MFQLDAEIDGWRRRLAASGSCTGQSLDELESHLRESHASLVASGLTSEEAFLIAARRLGDPDALQSEYAKEHPVGRTRLLWMLAGFLAIQSLIVLAGLLQDIGSISVVAFGARGDAIYPLVIAATLACFIAAGCILWSLRKRLFASVATSPLRWTTFAVLFIMVGQVSAAFSLSVSARIVEPQDFATIAVLRNLMALALTILIPVVLFIGIARLRRRERRLS